MMRARVSSGSVIQILDVPYTVPSRLIHYALMTIQNKKLIDDLKQLLHILKLPICLEQFQSIAERCKRKNYRTLNFFMNSS